MSDRKRETSSVVIDLPFNVVDAFAHLFLTLRVEGNVRQKRINTSSGSCEHQILSTSNSVLVELTLTALANDRTHLWLATPGLDISIDETDQLLGETVNTIIMMHTALSENALMPPIEQLNIPIPPSEERRTRKPSKDDSIERWLDWRDREKARTGHAPSLTDIAKETGHSLSTLKKQSALRNQKEPKLEP